MNEIKLTSQFKKDLKRYQHREEVIEKLDVIINLLANDKPIPALNRPHRLSGNYKGYMECHVESDTLLIWWNREECVIKLIRFGTHSELF